LAEGSQIKTIRDRTKEHLPMVLLTLLSIVQALALELLWSHVREATYLFEMSQAALITWLQIGTNFLGIIVIWIVYACSAMRFRWVPTISDSVYPFVVGLLEFILIETLAPALIAWWFACLALIFGIMTWVSHMTMRRARLDDENAEFFADLEPATARDFYPAFIIVSAFVLVAIYLSVSGDTGYFALLAVSAAFVVLIRQMIVASRFWNLSVVE
jgi:hypothetical protein